MLLDTLLLARCDFLLKSISAVSEFAIYFSPALNEHSWDAQVRTHARSGGGSVQA